MEYHLNIRRNDSNHIKNNRDDILIEIWIKEYHKILPDGVWWYWQEEIFWRESLTDLQYK